MLEERRIRGYLVSPPCTSFSPAAYPAVRSYEIPRGFDPTLEKVQVGNKLAFASITLLHGGLRLKCFGLGEQPWGSKMRWLREWGALVKRGAREVKVASCAFGSPHQKEFCFVGVNMKVELLEARCTRDHKHIPIQGRFTRPSSVYTPLLAKKLASFFKAHIDAIEKAEIRYDLRACGLEDAVSNDILLSADWKEEASWPWKGRSHINVLEAEAVTKLFRIVAKQGGDCRLTYFIDSHVAKSALCRGRSASFALQKVLKKACSLCLAFGLYPANRFAPTRINPADHPTRDTTIEKPVPLSLWKSLDARLLTSLSQLPRLRRWISNWARLVLLSSEVSKFSRHPFLNRRHAQSVIAQSEWTLDFDSTLGFPGEGPPCSPCCFLRLPFLFRLLLLGCRDSGAVSFGASHGDAARLKQRAGIVLEDGRRVELCFYLVLKIGLRNKAYLSLILFWQKTATLMN